MRIAIKNYSTFLLNYWKLNKLSFPGDGNEESISTKTRKPSYSHVMMLIVFNLLEMNETGSCQQSHIISNNVFRPTMGSFRT